MKYKDLKEILKVDQGVLTLSRDQFEDSGIEDLFYDFFQTDSFSIEKAVSTPDDDKEIIELLGILKGTFLGIKTTGNIKVNLKGEFSIIGEEPLLVLQMSIEDEWLLSEVFNDDQFADLAKDLGMEKLLAHPIKMIDLDSAANTIKMTINPNLSLGLSEIPQYLKGAEVDHSFPKTDFPSFNKNLSIDSFEFSVDLDTLRLNLLGLEVKLQDKDQSWAPLGKWLLFKEFSIHFLLFNPLATPIVNVELSTIVEVGKSDLIGTIFLPSKEFRCHLSDNTPINIKEMLEDLVGSSIPMSAMTCSSLGFVAEPENGRFEIYATVTDVLEIDLGEKDKIVVEELSSDFVYLTKPTKEMQGGLKGKIKLDSVEFQISVQHLGKDSGWQISGMSGPGQKLPVGDFLVEIATKFGAKGNLPGPLRDFTIQDLSISFDTKNKNFTFGCEGDLPFDGKIVKAVVNISLTKEDTNPITNGDYKNKQESGYKIDFGGYFEIGPFDDVGYLQFDLHLIKDKDATRFASSFMTKGEGLHFSLSQIISSLSSSTPDIPVNLFVNLKDILLVFDKPKPTTEVPKPDLKFLFALDIGLKIDLSKLPLVGKILPADKSVGFDKLQFMLTNATIKSTEVEAWNNESLLPEGLTLPNSDLKKGLGIDGVLNLGGLESPVSLPVAGDSAANNPPTSPSAGNGPPAVNSPPSSPDKAKYFTIQKKLGPIFFERVGMTYSKGSLWFLLDASLTAAGLNIGLQGLSVGSSLKKFDPKFRLNGLGIDFKKGPLEIGGAFLRFGESEYDGTAIISAGVLTLAAIGSYAIMKVDPQVADSNPEEKEYKSLFIYAVLDFPLGGPPFFVVTGLAAGFGYNRRLITPGITEVASFPLIQEAVSGAPSIPSGTGKDQQEGIMSELTKLHTYIPPMQGEYFVAVGIKFNSFEIIDSFALLTISFGKRFELDLLGLATLVLPTPEEGSEVDPLAEIQLAIKVAFAPDEGFLSIEAQLTNNSFLFSRKCQLTGGFAFYCWFKDQVDSAGNSISAGDFVISIGGYHPRYKVPKHYPSVPRLGFIWQVAPELCIKGGLYFALTASAVMAGGRLEAVFKSGGLKAWFIIGADFLIAWKPYHYDAEVYLSMGVALTFNLFGTHTISLELGADLHIWGPDFSGLAKLKILIFTIPIKFGAGASQKVEALKWTAFRTSFLPADDKDLVSVTMPAGLKSQPDTENVNWIVSAKEMVFETNSIIPFDSMKIGEKAAVATEGNKEFGIGPMNLTSDKVKSIHHISVIENVNGKDITDIFKLEPVFKQMPKALWGESLTPDMNGGKFVKHVQTGIKLSLLKTEEEPTYIPESIDQYKFQTTPKPRPGLITSCDLPSYTPKKDTEWKVTIEDNLKSNDVRDEMLEALGYSPKTDFNVSAQYIDELMLEPQMD